MRRASVLAHAARCEAELHTTKAQLAATDLEAAQLREISSPATRRIAISRRRRPRSPLICRCSARPINDPGELMANELPETVQLLQDELARLGNEIRARDAEVYRVSAHAARCEAELHTTKAQLAAADLEAARLRANLISHGRKNAIQGAGGRALR